MRFAYADPPYPGQAAKHYRDHPDYAGEVDHAAPIASLGDYDAAPARSGVRGWRGMPRACSRPTATPPCARAGPGRDRLVPRLLPHGPLHRGAPVAGRAAGGRSPLARGVRAGRAVAAVSVASTRVCGGCGTRLPPSASGRPRKWCSERCRKRQGCEACAGVWIDGGDPATLHIRVIECPFCDRSATAGPLYVAESNVTGWRADGEWS